MKNSLTNVVPCGKCSECLAKRANNWSFRLIEEQKVSHSSAFITLTYADPPLSINGNQTLHKKDMQDFMKRLRKKCFKKLKYYTVGEYGTKLKRPHYHSIIFNLPPSYIYDDRILADIWTHGHVDIAPCNEATIKYTLKYLQKEKWEPKHELDDRNPEFSMMSKKMGLSYLTPEILKYHHNTLNSYVTRSQGQKEPLPRYYRDKIFTKEQKIKIAEKGEIHRTEKYDKLFNGKKPLDELEYRKEKVRKQEKYKRDLKQKS